jgi:hypothetical protein
MNHIYHSLFSAIAAHEAASTRSTDSYANAPAKPAQRRAPCGSFALPVGRAIALQPHAAAVLHISQGSAWVTLPSQPGDHFLQAGDTLHIFAGDRVVMEPCHRPSSPSPAAETLYFEWDAAPQHIANATAASNAAAHGVALRGSWHRLPAQTAPRASYCAAVLAPLADLRAALVLGAGAAARLTVGLATWGLAAAWRAVLAGTARFATAFVAARAVFTLA